MRISDWSSDVCSSDLTPNAYDKARMAASKGYDLTHSLGLTIDKDGVAGSILWNGPAFRADIVNGTKIVAVDGVAYRKDRLETAIRSEERRVGKECVRTFRSRGVP